MQNNNLKLGWKSELRRAMDQYFSEGDLDTLCFDLNIDYEHLSGENKGQKIIELIKHCERNGRIVDLIDGCQLQRPNVSWEKIKVGSQKKEVDDLKNETVDIDDYDAAKNLILDYLERRELKSISFEGVRKSVFPLYEDEFLLKLIQKYHDLFFYRKNIVSKEGENKGPGLQRKK